MRGKRTFELNYYQRGALAAKDNFESDGAIDKAIVKEPVVKNSMKGLASPKLSPVSIFASLAPNMPDMPLLPRSVVETKQSPPPAAPLPPTAVWGRAHKLMLTRRSRHSTLEDVIDEHLSEELTSRARLQLKAPQRFEPTKRNEKAMERGLLEKHWKKHRAERHLARMALEAMLAAETDDVESEELGEESVEKKMRKPPRRNALVRDKTRRNGRQAARDRKCFAVGEPGEEEALELAATLFKKESPAERRNETKVARLPSTGVDKERSAAVVTQRFLDQAIHSCARPPVKEMVGTKSERKAKEKNRGLDAKYWAKYHSLKRVKHAMWQAFEALQAVPEDEAGEDEDEGASLPSGPTNSRKPPRDTKTKREKIRRSARCNARDRKCFEYGEPHEWIPFPAEQLAATHQKTTAFVPLALLALLQRESTGASLSELSRGGVLLSREAATDLSDMMTSLRKQTYRRRIKTKSEETKKAAAAAVEKRVGSPLPTKMNEQKTYNDKVPKVGTMSYLRQPALLKAKGKRGN